MGRREAAVFSRYLTGRSCGKELATRYLAACERLCPDGALTPPEQNLLRTAVRLPFLAGPLDAACGLLPGSNPLRTRLLIMAAVLEASPDGARHFLPAGASLPRVLLLSAALTTKSIVKTLIGLAVLPLARGRWLTS